MIFSLEFNPLVINYAQTKLFEEKLETNSNLQLFFIYSSVHPTMFTERHTTKFILVLRPALARVSPTCSCPTLSGDQSQSIDIFVSGGLS